MKVDVVKYTFDWKIWFNDIAAELNEALEHVSCVIEHVGSTWVEGLEAKAIIDIDVILTHFDDLTLAKKALERVGYVYRGHFGLEGRELFEIHDPIYSYQRHPHHLYVCDPDSLALKNHLMFRDYLKNNSEMAKQYGVIKQALATKFPHNMDAYCEAKSEFIADVLTECHFELNEIKAIKIANVIGVVKSNK